MLIAALAILGTIDQKRVHLIDSYPESARNFLFAATTQNKTENGYTLYAVSRSKSAGLNVALN